MYLVYPSGSVSRGDNDGIGSVYASYGSPDTGNRLNPCVIMNRGVVAGYNFSIFVDDSYGSPDTGWGNDVCYVYPDGDINDNEYVWVDDSYGK